MMQTNMPVSQRPPLRASVITSWDPRGALFPNSTGWDNLDLFNHPLIRPAAQSGAIGIDMYAWMEPELWEMRNEVRPNGWNGQRPISVADWMCGIDGRHIPLLASKVLDWKQRCGQSGLRLPIIAMSSFLPEIAINARARKHDAATAISALRELSLFATYLARADEHREPIAVVEIVGGSRFSDLRWSHEENGIVQCTIDVDSGGMSVDSLMNNINSVLDELYRIMGDEFARVPPYAIELEPGEFFTVNGWQALTELAQRIRMMEDESPHLAGKVGLNLDITHWRMANITLGMVEHEEDIRNRIAHCHVSGHHRLSHFGDTELRDEDLIEIREWLKFVKGLTAENPTRRVPFSGWVSLEYEMARGVETVAKSLARLCAMLAALD